MKAIPSVVAQHAEEVAFLSLLRERVAGSSLLRLAALAEFDARIDAHLDGLRACGDDGWRAAERGLAAAEPGELFAAAVLAFESGVPARLEPVLAAAAEVEHADLALERALAWIEPIRAAAVLPPLLDAAEPAARSCALAFAASERRLSAARLADELRAGPPQLRAGALRAAARLGGSELGELAEQYLRDPDPEVREQAAWTATLLRRAAGAPSLWAIGRSESPRADRALDLALRSLEPRAAAELLDELMREPTQVRRALLGCASLGDPERLPWVVERMGDPVVGRAAGAAFAAITGLDLAREKLALPADAAPRADGDEPPPDDADLPAPDPEQSQAWLARNARALRRSPALLAGRAKTAADLRQTLRDGRQTERAAASLELALGAPDTPLFDVAAPSFRQVERLGVAPWA